MLACINGRTAVETEETFLYGEEGSAEGFLKQGYTRRNQAFQQYQFWLLSMVSTAENIVTALGLFKGGRSWAGPAKDRLFDG